MSDTTEEKIEAAQAGLIELESMLGQRVAEARGLLTLAADELRRAKAEAARSHLEYFTEAEFAARLRVSEDTIQRLRLKGEMPHVKLAGCVRYTSEHLAEVAAKFRWPKPTRVAAKRGAA